MIHPHIHIRLRLDERHRDTPPVILWRPKPGRPRHYHSPQLHMLGAWAHTRRSATMTPRPAKKRRGVTATSPRPIASRAAAFPTCAGGGRCSGSAVRVKVRRGYLRNGLAMTVEQVKGFACRTAWTEAASPWYGVVGRPPLGVGWMGTCAISPGGATGGALRLLDRHRESISQFFNGLRLYRCQVPRARLVPQHVQAGGAAVDQPPALKCDGCHCETASLLQWRRPKASHVGRPGLRRPPLGTVW